MTDYDISDELLIPVVHAAADLIVARCSFCSGGHVHRGAGGVRRAGCGAGEYLVVAVPGVTRGRQS